MKKGKAVGLYDIPEGVWKFLCVEGYDFLIKLFNDIFMSGNKLCQINRERALDGI